MIHQPFVAILLIILAIALMSFFWGWSGEKIKEMDISDGEDID